MTIPSSTDARSELEKLAESAKEQGRIRIQAICLLAIARIEELEAELVLAKTKGARARAAQLSPERRKQIAQAAAVHRWRTTRACGKQESV